VTEASLPAFVDVLLFEIQGGLFAADPAAVSRVERCRPDKPQVQLGAAARGPRALCIAAGGRELQLPVDTLLGIRSAPRAALRRLPEFARGLGARPVAGVVLLEDRPALLLDLAALVEGPAAAPSPLESRDYQPKE
jgi:hypothetical protein